MVTSGHYPAGAGWWSKIVKAPLTVGLIDSRPFFSESAL